MPENTTAPVERTFTVLVRRADGTTDPIYVLAVDRTDAVNRARRMTGVTEVVRVAGW